MKTITKGNASVSYEVEKKTGAYIQETLRLKVGALVVARNLDYGIAISCAEQLRGTLPRDTTYIRSVLVNYGVIKAS